MNTILFKRTSFLLSLATLTVVSSGLKAQAQTTDFTAADVKTQPTLDTKALTSASALMAEPSADQNPEATSETTDPVVAQVDGTTPGTTPDGTTPGTGGIAPGRATRSGPSYVGIAGNIGLSGGETALGIGNFTVISKIGLAEAVSVRPAVVIGDNTTFLIPVTYDFNLRPTGAAAEPISTFAPYVGGGLVIATGNDDSDFGGLVSAGVDVPINPQFTATAGVNVGILDNTSVGLLIGAGYNF